MFCSQTRPVPTLLIEMIEMSESLSLYFLECACETMLWCFPYIHTYSSPLSLSHTHTPFSPLSLTHTHTPSLLPGWLNLSTDHEAPTQRQANSAEGQWLEVIDSGACSSACDHNSSYLLHISDIWPEWVPSEMYPIMRPVQSESFERQKLRNLLYKLFSSKCLSTR